MTCFTKDLRFCFSGHRHFHSRRGPESLLLEAQYPHQELLRMPYPIFAKPSRARAAAAGEDPVAKEHCSWKAAHRAEGAGLPTAWAKPTL